MRKDRKLKLSKFRIAKIDNINLKGGVATAGTCETFLCLSYHNICDSIEICSNTDNTRNGNSLKP